MLEIVIVIVILGVLTVTLIMPGVMRANSQKRLVSCGSNLQSLSQALALYSREYYAQFPPELARLEPDYLQRIPRCPSSNSDYDYSTGANSMVYTIFCPGESHKDARAQANYPQYTSASGLNLGNKTNPR